MKFAFRLDSSAKIGFGHASRCLALARELLSIGSEVVFVFTELDDYFRSQLEEMGISGVEIDPDLSDREDAIATLQLVGSDSGTVVVLDSYRLGIEWEETVREFCKRLVIFADQLSNDHNCEVIIDSSLSSRVESDWRELYGKETLTYVGPQFACLRRSIRKVRESRIRERVKSSRVMIYFGNSIDDDFLAELVPLLKSDVFEFDVVFPQVDDVIRKISDTPSNVRTVPSGEGFDKLLEQADYAVGAGGVSALERICIGIPQVIFISAANQIDGSEEMARRGICVLGGHLSELNPEKVAELLFAGLRRLAGTSLVDSCNVGRSIIDGLGAVRLANLLVGNIESRIGIRNAKHDDVDTLFRWVNDPDVRKNSLNKSPIDYETHKKWYEDTLDNPDAIVFVAQINELPIGQVRFNIHHVSAELDYSIDRDFRGMGISRVILEESLSRIILQVKRVTATVLTSNHQSIRALSRVGFRLESSHGQILKYELNL